MGQKKSSFKFGAYEIAVSGIMGAIALVLSFTPLGLIPLPNGTGAATTLHVPVIVAGIIAGPISGAVTGLILAIRSFQMYFAVFMAAAGENLFLAILSAFLPRILMGMSAFYVYKLLSFSKANINPKVKTLLSIIASFVAAIVSTTVNTVGVLGLLIVFGKADLGILIGAFVTNYPIEILAAAIIIIPVVEALRARSPERLAAAQ